MTAETSIHKDEIRSILEKVMDPEIPVLSVVDLGIIRDIEIINGKLVVAISPTYSGCPAMDMIAASIKMELMANGYHDPQVITKLHPAWTTDWITDKGRMQLKEYGIAPPSSVHHTCVSLFREESVQCPHCGSWHTATLSEFGSTPCKALYKCDDCLEPFDYFKCH